jgi:hypothetical protein
MLVFPRNLLPVRGHYRIIAVPLVTPGWPLRRGPAGRSAWQQGLARHDLRGEARASQ